MYMLVTDGRASEALAEDLSVSHPMRRLSACGFGYRIHGGKIDGAYGRCLQ